MVENAYKVTFREMPFTPVKSMLQITTTTTRPDIKKTTKKEGMAKAIALVTILNMKSAKLISINANRLLVI